MRDTARVCIIRALYSSELYILRIRDRMGNETTTSYMHEPIAQDITDDKNIYKK